ncbi:MAG: MarR family transcriptional regulator [Caulobacteraceae bacterium]|nr:MarR family transcriptional regulator [Caulobacteraceae bacterium]
MAARTSQRPVAARSTRTGASRPSKPRLTARDAEQPDTIDASQIDFGPLSQYLGYYLRRLYDGYRKHFVAQAADLDVQPREVGALFVIGLNPGLTPSQLSVALALDGAQITAMLNMFDSRGLVERRVSSVDARSRLVYLTPAGKRMLDKLRKLVGGFDRSFAGDALTDAELGQLIGLLAKLHAGIGD